MSHVMRCAWCGRDAGRTDAEDSHGICRPCAEALLGVPLLSAAELDALPFGVIGLDDSGTVVSYNLEESATSRRPPVEVLGRNFFREVAPCTRVREFEGRFRQLDAGGPPVVTFPFRFAFAHGMTDVEIAFVRTEGAVTWVAVRRYDRPAPMRQRAVP